MQSIDEIRELAGRVLDKEYLLYLSSVIEVDGKIFFLAKDKSSKWFFILANNHKGLEFTKCINKSFYIDNNYYFLYRLDLNYNNLVLLKKILFHIKPVRCSAGKSFGTGDRVGLVSAAHIKCFEDKDIFAIIAQQSAREIKRTCRTWQDVINDATWGYLESGSKKPFGADADHVKENEDLKIAASCGFSMFTVDPSEYITDASSLSNSEIAERYSKINNLKTLEQKYLGKSFKAGNRVFQFEKDLFVPIAVKYLKAINHVNLMYEFLKSCKKDSFDFEVSMDEVEEPVSALEHFFISRELHDLGVSFNNLALRFSGRWEKAIDYAGDLKLLENELKSHSEVVNAFGTYKLSLHSGSEKLSTYKMFSEITEGNFHIKTAGTSYLEALRAVAKTDPDFFRNIFIFSLQCFEKDKNSYHLSTDLKKLPDISKIADDMVDCFLDFPDSRQVLHVTFGSVLTSAFKNEIYLNLFENEKIHYRYVSLNIEKHLNLLIYRKGYLE